MIGSTILSLLLLCPSPTRSFPNMNEGAYLLSQTPKQKHNNWSTNFADYPGGVEYIEFYPGPIQSTYSEVFWTRAIKGSSDSKLANPASCHGLNTCVLSATNQGSDVLDGISEMSSLSSSKSKITSAPC